MSSRSHDADRACLREPRPAMKWQGWAKMFSRSSKGFPCANRCSSAIRSVAIFASPHDVMTGDFKKFDEAMTERQARAFERGVPQARVLRWPHASHYLFIAQQRDVLREVTAFIATLPRPPVL